MKKQRALLIGYYENDTQIDELVYEQKKLEAAGYQVINIIDFMTDPDTGVKINGADEKPLFAALALHVDIVADYFGTDDDVCDRVMTVARAMRIPIRFSTSLHWNKVKHTSDGWIERIVARVDEMLRGK